jgi:hypothetical protein
MEFREVFVRFQERLLQDIFSIFPVLRDILRQPENIALIAFGQPVERFGIALASLGYQGGFIENGGFVWQALILALASHDQQIPRRVRVYGATWMSTANLDQFAIRCRPAPIPSCDRVAQAIRLRRLGGRIACPTRNLSVQIKLHPPFGTIGNSAW